MSKKIWWCIIITNDIKVKQLNLKLTEKQLDDLELLSKAMGNVNKSNLIRIAITEYIMKYNVLLEDDWMKDIWNIIIIETVLIGFYFYYGYFMRRDINRFILLIGIIFMLSGLNLVYLYTFSPSTSYLVVAIINLVVGLIFLISYKYPKLQKILIKN